MAKAKKTEYPEKLFVLRANAGTDDEFLQAAIYLNDLALETGETAPVGVYKLINTVRVKNKTTIEEGD